MTVEQLKEAALLQSQVDVYKEAEQVWRSATGITNVSFNGIGIVVGVRPVPDQEVFEKIREAAVYILMAKRAMLESDFEKL